MERESCLITLITLFGGIAILACGWPHPGPTGRGNALSMERLRWRRIWLPLAPALIVAAWLCGWALAEPDPVPERVPAAILIASVPFILLFARTAIRAVWSLVRDDGDPGTATVGLLKPWILFSPHLARTLDQAEIDAALEHERAHARHHDPLRIWLAQLATDLQWPWPQAQERFRHWLVALELARDEEARMAGIEGADLAAAIMAAARLRRPPFASPLAALIGEQSVLKERIACLLEPRRDEAEASGVKAWLPWILVPGLLIALFLGSIFGETVIRGLLRLAA
jgi:hypothetical protein